MTFIRYIGVNFTFGLLHCVRCNEDFVISRFCSIHFTVTLAEDFVIQGFVKWSFHCILSGWFGCWRYRNDEKVRYDQEAGNAAGVPHRNRRSLSY